MKASPDSTAGIAALGVTALMTAGTYVSQFCATSVGWGEANVAAFSLYFNDS